MESKNPWIFTIINQLASMLTIILGAVFYFGVHKEFPDYRQLIANGEILILCVPTIASMLLTLYFLKEKWDNWVAALLFGPNILFLACASAIWAFNFSQLEVDVTPLDQLNLDEKEMASSLIVVTSWIVFITTTISLFFSYYVENNRVRANVLRVREKAKEELEKKIKAQKGK